MDVTILHLQSLSMQVPPAGHPTELSEEGVPQWRCCVETESEACFGSFKALATQNGDSVQTGSHKSMPSL